jgi:hypothetical protein
MINGIYFLVIAGLSQMLLHGEIVWPLAFRSGGNQALLAPGALGWIVEFTFSSWRMSTPLSVNTFRLLYQDLFCSFLTHSSLRDTLLVVIHP